MSPQATVAPTRTDGVARSLSEVVGGPVGAHARPHRWWTPVRVLLALVTVTFGLSLVHTVPCLETGWSNDQARYGKMCYSDVPYLYTARGLAEGRWPYSSDPGHRTMEYPVGISYVAWGVAEVTRHLFRTGPPDSLRRATRPVAQWGLVGMGQETNRYFLLTALTLFLALLAATAALARARPGRPWDALPFVLSPMLLLTGLINWDLLAVVLVAGALAAWAGGRTVLTGVLIGLGTATKLYPFLLLGAVLVIAVRRRRWSEATAVTAAAVAAWTLAQVPAWVTGIAQWRVFWAFNARRPADLGSPWLLLSDLGFPVATPLINALTWLLLGGLCAAVGVLGLRARRTPRLDQLGLLLVTGFVIVNKVYSPQYVLWLLPLAVIARPRWRDLLVWQATELFYLVAIWSYLGGWWFDASGTHAPLYDAAIVIRILGELYLAAMVVRDLLTPERLHRIGPASDSADPDLVEGGDRVPDAHVDQLADRGHRDAVGQEEHRALHVRGLGEPSALAVDGER